MVVLPPQGVSDTYGQLPDTGADTIRARRYGFARQAFTAKRMSSTEYLSLNLTVPMNTV